MEVYGAQRSAARVSSRPCPGRRDGHVRPSLGPGDALITSTRILAVRADPAEADPGTQVTFTSLVASPSGTVASAAIAWSFCDGAEAADGEQRRLERVLDGVRARLGRHGADDHRNLAGRRLLALRSRHHLGRSAPDDPDGTGGYYQPLRLDLAGADVAFELARIHCDLPDADATVASAFAAAYRPNQNPVLLPLTATSRHGARGPDGHPEGDARHARGELAGVLRGDVRVLRRGLADRDSPARVDAGRAGTRPEAHSTRSPRGAHRTTRRPPPTTGGTRRAYPGQYTSGLCSGTAGAESTSPATTSSSTDAWSRQDRAHAP